MPLIALKKQHETSVILGISAVIVLVFLGLSGLYGVKTFISSTNSLAENNAGQQSDDHSKSNSDPNQPSELVKNFAALGIFKHTVKPGNNTVKKTRLRLKLHGVVDDNDSSPSSVAIISGGKSSGELTYQIGDDLPGGAKLIEVHPDHIVLTNRGSRESLYLPKNKLKPNEAILGNP